MLWTRERVLEAMRFQLEEDTGHAMTRIREARDAVRPQRRTVKNTPRGTVTTIEHGGAPDWDTRLRASELTLGLTGVLQRQTDESDRADRPIAVTVILAPSDAHTAIPSGRVAIHLTGDESG